MYEPPKDTARLTMEQVKTLPCQRCQTIRGFVLIGGLLIIAIYLQPVWARALAAKMPEPISIGVALCLASVVVFLLRVARERRARRLVNSGEIEGTGAQR